MQPDLVSVVIPSYNHQKFIRKSITSVLEQTYTSIELIVVDDGSKDNSVSLVQSMMAEYKGPHRFRLIQQTNFGAHAAIEKGIAESNGEFIAILNSDDYFSIDRLQKLVHVLKTENADLTYSLVQHVDTLGRNISAEHPMKQSYDHFVKLSEIYGYDFVICGYSLSISTGNFVFRKSLHQKIGPFLDYKTVHDWAFVLKAQAIAKVVAHPEMLLFYRVHENNTIGSGYDDSKDTFALLSEYFKLAHSDHRSESSPSELSYPYFFRFFLRKYFPAVCDIFEHYEKTQNLNLNYDISSYQKSIGHLLKIIDKTSVT